MIAISCDDVASHNGWIKDIQCYAKTDGSSFPYPIIGDESRRLANLLGMVDDVEKDPQGMPLTCRAVYIINPEKKVKMMMLYPATSGRSFDELLRIVDSLQLVEKSKNTVATPQGWTPGQKVMVTPGVKQEDVPTLFPQGVEVTSLPSGKQYVRTTTV